MHIQSLYGSLITSESDGVVATRPLSIRVILILRLVFTTVSESEKLEESLWNSGL